MKSRIHATMRAVRFIPVELVAVAICRRERIEYAFVDTLGDFTQDGVHPSHVLRNDLVRALSLPLKREALRDALALLKAAIVNPNGYSATLKGGVKCCLITHQTITAKL